LFFEGLKQAMLRINNNYWKHQLEDKNKSQTTCTLQIYLSKNPCLDPSRPSSTPERVTNSDRWSQKGPRPLFPLLSTHPENLPLLGNNILGLDGQLTLAVKGAKGTISLAQAKDTVPGPNCILKSLWG